MIRCDTFLSLRLSSLCFNCTHGPHIREGGSEMRAPMLTFILNPSDVKGGQSCGSGNNNAGSDNGVMNNDGSKIKKKKEVQVENK